MDLSSLPLPSDIYTSISSFANNDEERIHLAVTLKEGKATYDAVRSTPEYWLDKLEKEHEVKFKTNISDPVLLERFYYIASMSNVKLPVSGCKSIALYLPDIFQFLNVIDVPKEGYMKVFLYYLYIFMAIIHAPNTLGMIFEHLAKADDNLVDKDSILASLAKIGFLDNVVSHSSNYEGLEVFLANVNKYFPHNFYFQLKYVNPRHPKELNYHPWVNYELLLASISKVYPNVYLKLRIKDEQLAQFLGLVPGSRSLYSIPIKGNVLVYDAILNVSNFDFIVDIISHINNGVNITEGGLEFFLAILSSYYFLKGYDSNGAGTYLLNILTHDFVTSFCKKDFQFYLNKTTYKEKLVRLITDIAKTEDKPFLLSLLEN